MALQLVITNAGRAAVINQAEGGFRSVRIAAVGVSPTAVAAAPAATTLPGEVKRIASIAGEATAADVVHLTVTDESDATYAVRSFALYLSDGTLFALYGQADPIVEKSAQALLLLAIDVTLAAIPAAAITFGNANFTNPAATVERPGVVELATAAEAKAGTDPARGITPATARAAVRDWIGYTPANRQGDTFTGLVAIRTGAFGLRISDPAVPGAGYVQLGEDADAVRNWHFGTPADGTWRLFQGTWGSGIERLGVTSTAIYFNSNVMWHAGNDGAGSGLDADLLDGLQASQLLRADLPTTAAPNVFYDLPNTTWGKSLRVGGNGYTAAGQVASLIATDGTVHVDATNGRDIYLNFYSGLGVRFGDGKQNTVARMSEAGVLNAAAVDATAMRRAGLHLWGPDNDGAGSGLDADLLDGVQASQLLRGDIPATTAPNVYYDFPNTNWGKSLRIGGNGYTAGGKLGSLIATDGTVHLDAAERDIYLNYYGGLGVSFGNGRQAIVARISEAGAISGTAVDAPVMRRAGLHLWGPDNDGAGSGLDADLLDGQQGSWYADVMARLGFTPANRAGDTFTGVVAIRSATTALRISEGAGSGYGFIQFGEHADAVRNWHAGSQNDGSFRVYQGNWGTGIERLGITATTLTFNAGIVWHTANDGAGSGLDADLLDGRDGSFYLPAGSYTPGDVLGKLVTVDGAGSGLDADLLDGWQRDDIRDWNNLLNRPGSFPAAPHGHGAADIAGAFPASLAGNGYTVLPNGLILQWVTGAQQGAGSEGSQYVTFPIAFNACFQVFASTQVANVNTESHATYQLVSFGNEGATVMRQLVSSAGSDREPSWPRLFAIGR